MAEKLYERTTINKDKRIFIKNFSLNFYQIFWHRTWLASRLLAMILANVSTFFSVSLSEIIAVNDSRHKIAPINSTLCRVKIIRMIRVLFYFNLLLIELFSNISRSIHSLTWSKINGKIYVVYYSFNFSLLMLLILNIIF